jgi:hypothetical protein
VRVLVVPLLAAGFAFGLATAATELANGPGPQATPPTSVIWSDRVFSSRHELAVWLQARGAAYETWAALHPGARSVLEPERRTVASAGSSSSADAAVPADSTSRTLAIVALAASVLGIFSLTVVARAKSMRRVRRRASAPSRRAQARTAGTKLRTRSRRPVSQAASFVTFGSRLRRRMRDGLPLPLLGARERNTVEAKTLELDSILVRESLRQYAPDLGLYVASALLACVVGISIALYLN